jgi:hypothetical protein
VLAGDPALGIVERARAASLRSTSTFYKAYRAGGGPAPR